MAKPTGLAVAKNAAAKAKAGFIAYQQQDCQSFVENCVRDCGGVMDYAGSNDMFRNACSWLGTVDEAIARGKLSQGALVFKHAFDNGEPEKYKKDGKGNARHVGLYCGADGVEVAHSTPPGAQAAKLSAGWTHVGLYEKGIHYQAADLGEGDDGVKTGRAMVWADNGSFVYLRSTPGTEKPYLAKVLLGTEVEVAETAVNSAGAEWSKVVLPSGISGFMMARFLRLLGGNEGWEGQSELVTRAEFAALETRVATLENGRHRKEA